MTHYLQNRTLFQPLIYNKPSLNLGISIVIPCYDEDFLLFSLMSIKKCDLPKSDVEVIVVINDSEVDSEKVKIKNEETYEQAIKWSKQNNSPRLKFHILYQQDLPKKHAGVGLARKIGMDEATWRFHKIRNRRGIIVCFDADSRCEKNYLQAIENHFLNNPRYHAASIYYEHPVQGIDFEDEIYEAIVLYELHLRYYVNAQKWAGFPFATQTIGSSMAVKYEAYQAQGGMNRRKAGEDFYFIHKFTSLGHYSEIKNTKVIPSPRVSHRVPFGTGKAVGDLCQKTEDGYLTYNPKGFEDLKSFLKQVKDLFTLEREEIVNFQVNLPDSVTQFLEQSDFVLKVLEIQSNTTNIRSFKNRFFKWFNAFMVMKYLHYARDNFYENIEVVDAANWFLTLKKPSRIGTQSPKQILELFRQMDRM